MCWTAFVGSFGVGVQIIESLDLFCVGVLIGRGNVFFVLQVH